MAEVVYTAHARIRMQHNGVSHDEIMEVLETGAFSLGESNKLIREKVFTAGYQRRGRYYPHKEVRAIFVDEIDVTTVITVRARYGRFAEVI